MKRRYSIAFTILLSLTLIGVRSPRVSKGSATELALPDGWASDTTAFAKPRRQSRLAQGAWGGQHITIEVNESSATVEFDCAHGQIDGPLVVDRRGRFNLKGTFEGEHGGPVRI